MALLVVVASAAVASVLIVCRVMGVEDNVLTLALTVVLAVWIAWYFGSSKLCAKEAAEVRKVC